MRKTRLADSYRLQRFLGDYRDHISFVNEMKVLIESDELAKDVAGAEALLERHQEHKVLCAALSISQAFRHLTHNSPVICLYIPWRHLLGLQMLVCLGLPESPTLFQILPFHSQE